MAQERDNSKLILLTLLGFSAAFIVGALFAGNYGELIPGFIRICTRPSQFTMDYFKLGSLGSAFLNTGLVGLICCAWFYATKAKCSGLSVAAFWLNVGFCTFGMNVVNILPFLLAGFIYAKVRKQSLASVANGALFASALAPFISELIFRYPNLETSGFSVIGLIGAIVLAIAIMFVMPALCAHAPNFHKGFDLYSAGPAAGFLAFLVYCVLYKTVGIEVPTNTDLGAGHRWFVTIFFVIVFVACIVAGYMLDKNCFKEYKKLWKSSGYKCDFTAAFGMPATLVNMGLYGLFVVGYFFFVQGMTLVDGALVFTGAKFTGATMGAIMCMCAFFAQGVHPRNVFPIMIGYAVASLLPFTLYATGVVDAQSWTLTTQGILVGMCFASGLAPVAGKYGFVAGVIAGMMHAFLVTSVPLLHGGFCLYNGGFTAGIVAFLIAPVLETYAKVKNEN